MPPPGTCGAGVPSTHGRKDTDIVAWQADGVTQVRDAGVITAPSLRKRLTRLVLACLLPFVVLALLLAATSYSWNRERAVARTADVARGIALAVERELRVMTASMEALAFSPSLAAGNLDAFRGEADALIARHFPGATIILLEPDGPQLLNTQRLPGAPLPVRATMDATRRVVATGRPTVSDLYQGTVLLAPVIAVDVPVRDASGRVTRVLSLGPPLSVFTEILHAQRPQPGWVVSIFDRAGVNVARTPNPERFVGVPASPSLRPLLLASDEGRAETTSLEGTPLLVAWSRPGPSGWSVGIGLPQAQLYAPLWRSLGITAGLSVLALLGALLLARMLASRIARPITALVGLAHRRGVQGGPSLGLREADEVAAALAGAEGQRAASETRLSRIFEAAHDHAIIVLDPAGRIAAWNPGAEKLFGWTAADILGRDAATFFTPEDRAAAVPESEMRGARGKRPGAGRAVAPAPRRQPLLGGRQHGAAARPRGRAGRLRQDLPRRDRAPAGRGGAAPERGDAGRRARQPAGRRRHRRCRRADDPRQRGQPRAVGHPARDNALGGVRRVGRLVARHRRAHPGA
jgi:PAS domain-containing protein